ncbi:type 1 glutamine amidotransferase [Entomomonas sp. E2T0]|uniref:type 1 glutamine amidotransferase domain-containing protein n=1 Tax=Entomomonas sp. E2T0 TaxID=2930213 RepID=UPI0022282EBE|nr:type 1 glutamine amidotransferase domain-containing protein [Entomomonas sp. E2T0]UYZ85379.1 type 1 glutamine amidotransferase [Entomomonas sp. E2T0]
MSKQVAVLITNEFEDSEFTSPAEAIKAAGHKITTIEKKAGNTITGKHDTKVTIDKSIDDVKPEDFDALLIPGGFSPDSLRGDDRFVNFTKHFASTNKPIFAICHGPQLMINAGIVKGKKMTTVKPVVIDLKNAGADFHDESVVVDNDTIVTSRTPDDLPDFNREIVRILNK